MYWAELTSKTTVRSEHWHSHSNNNNAPLLRSQKAAEDMIANIPSKQEPEPEHQIVVIQEGNEPDVPT